MMSREYRSVISSGLPTILFNQNHLELLYFSMLNTCSKLFNLF